MDEFTPPLALARLVRAWADVPAETREELVDALATLLVADAPELLAVSDALAAGAGGFTETVENPVAIARFADGSERAYGSIDDLIPGGLGGLMGDMRIRWLVMLRSQPSFSGTYVGLPGDATVEIVDQQRAVAELS